MLTILRGVKPDLVEKSLYPISKGVKPEKLNKGSSQLAKTSNLAYKIIPGALLFCLAVQCLLLSIGFITSTKALHTSDWMGRWFILAQDRQSTISFLTAAIATVAVLPSDFGLSDVLFTLIEAQNNLLNSAREGLLIGDRYGEFEGLVGLSPDLDTLHLADTCTGFSDSYFALSRCLSMDKAVGAAALLLRKIISVIDTNQTVGRNFSAARYNLRVSADFAKLILLTDGKLNVDLATFNRELLEFTQDLFMSITSSVIIVGIILVAFSILVMLASSPLYIAIEHTIDAVRTLLNFLPPHELLDDPNMVALILGTDTDSDAKVLTPSEVVMQRASEGVVSLSLDYTIDAVNASFIDITGLTADEVIGQSLRLIFPFPDAAEPATEDSPVPTLYSRLEQLKSGSATGVSSIEVSCTNEMGSPLNVTVTIVPHLDSDQRLTSFSLMLRDLSKQTAGEQKSLDIKNRCENIVQRLVPLEVYAHLKSSTHQNTAFMSNSATVIFVEILGFSEGVSSCSPSQMLEALSAICDVFDECANNYPSIRKLRYGANTILACAGLFEFQDQPADQVHHAIMTCLTFLSYQEDLDERLSLSLHIKCGVAFGGPLIGDLLGPNTPTFELSGDLVQAALTICYEADADSLSINSGAKALLGSAHYTTKRVNPAGRTFTDAFSVTFHEEE
jgi:PAS domain S-box-containing protein